MPNNCIINSFQSHEAFARIYQMLRYKGSVNIFQMTEITQSMFSNHNAIQLAINKNRIKLETSHLF